MSIATLVHVRSLSIGVHVFWSDKARLTYTATTPVFGATFASIKLA